MKQEILVQIQRLGGNIDHVKGRSLQEDLESIEFKCPIYPDDYGDTLYGIDESYNNNKQLYLDSRPDFYATLLDHFFSDHEIPYGQAFFRNFLFTPFREDSEDFGELDGLAEESEIREVVNGTNLYFMCICYSNGYPDHYFVCLTDPDQENPTVYGTDHEVYFQEIKNKGTLEDFFKRFLIKEEFLKVVENYIESIKEDK
ncbi:MAG TPA: hypothetical protein VK364_10125 [Hymenobacter sp.]|nr:hypothetical protein [Hymenobacter sp.]